MKILAKKKEKKGNQGEQALFYLFLVTNILFTRVSLLTFFFLISREWQYFSYICLHLIHYNFILMDSTTTLKPWIIDRFDDIRILRYEVPGFESLPLNEKILIYYLAQATTAGQRITIDQNFRYNIAITDTLKEVVDRYEGDRTSAEWLALECYHKKVWFANGIHHHYSGAKFTPRFSKEYFAEVVRATFEGERGEEILEQISDVIFDASLYPQRVSREAGTDIIKESACNYYDGVSQQEVEAYYDMLSKKIDSNISIGLNSQLAKDEDGVVYERVYKIGGLYSEEIGQIVYWLEKAVEYAQGGQRRVIELLIEYYRTGDLQLFDDMSIAWVEDTDSNVDFVNGFIEVYGDPLGRKASWEGLVNFRNREASRRTEIIAENAQWFENHSPINPAYRKSVVKGVSAKVITVAMLGGDCYPSTPIGINLPNAEWIRRDYGSKSVTLDNITNAYAEAAKGSGFNEEFYIDKATRELIELYGETTDSLHTDLHECLGHGSGQLAEGVSQTALGAYSSVIEECRADLFGLYYIGSKKLVELGLLPSVEAAKAQYTKYITNGALTQLSRIALGDDVEQTHMRNRKLISEWLLERGAGVVEMVADESDKLYVVVKDATALRQMFAELLCEIQRIKSEGDIEAARDLVERYAIRIDPARHSQIRERYDALGIEPYNGFINPDYRLIEEDGKIIDVDIVYRY